MVSFLQGNDSIFFLVRCLLEPKVRVLNYSSVLHRQAPIRRPIVSTHLGRLSPKALSPEVVTVFGTGLHSKLTITKALEFQLLIVLERFDSLNADHTDLRVEWINKKAGEKRCLG